MDFEIIVLIIVFGGSFIMGVYNFIIYPYIIEPILNYSRCVKELETEKKKSSQLEILLRNKDEKFNLLSNFFYSRIETENPSEKQGILVYIVDTRKKNLVKSKIPEDKLPAEYKKYCGENGEIYLKRYIENDKQKLQQISEPVYFSLLESLSRTMLLPSDILDAIAAFKSNLSAFPYMAGIVADFETYGIELLASKLDWGYSQERLKKVKSIREIRRDAKAMVEKNKESQYQLAYLLELYPTLSDVIECDFCNLPTIEVKDIIDYDVTRDYLTKEEYNALSTIERNQLALDRYNNSHTKSKWQIGRDYELYVGHKYSLKGYKVDYFGSYMGLEDLGRDLIAKKGGAILIIQCKYWSSNKLIHEKHITQLYGTLVSYCVENNLPHEKVKGVLVTNTQLSCMAKKIASHLNIDYVENYQKGAYPCIKCNINKSTGEHIYHLPFDQQYDSTKIEAGGEFYAMTVAEAEAAGFRRAFKWHGL